MHSGWLDYPAKAADRFIVRLAGMALRPRLVGMLAAQKETHMYLPLFTWLVNVWI